METEQERIKRMLAEGKITPADAERLNLALAKSKQIQESPVRLDPAGATRLSKLALASTLFAAFGVFVLFLPLHNSRSLSTATSSYQETINVTPLVAGIPFLTAIVLGIIALVVIRRNSQRLHGKGLAGLGIAAAMVIALLSFVLICR